MNRQDLHNRPTRYELIAERGDTRILIGYCMRTGRRSILDACVKHGPALIAFMGITDEHLLVFLKPAKLGAHIGPAANPWSVRFSGRDECTYSFWYVTTPNTAGVTPNACWILTTKWYVPKGTK